MKSHIDCETNGRSTAPSPRRFLSFKELRARGICYSRTHTWRMVRAGKFPVPVKLGPSRNAWVESEIDAWLDARIGERNVKFGIQQQIKQSSVTRGA
jgi:prophage regulatory protein